MAELKMRYRDLNHALRLLKSQVIEGIPYAKENLPEFKNPEQIFNYLKLRTRYKLDPHGVELFQTLPTLLENNFHGVTGSGDCDCLSIAVLSVCAAKNFKNFGIVLCGRNKFSPAHIYNYVEDENGIKRYIDLTNKVYDYQRPYPYKQEIKFNLTPKEKKMMLQLADNGQTSPYTGYIWLPSKGIQMREDLADTLSGKDFQNMLLSEGYELQEIAGLAGRRDRRIKKKEAREKRKADRSERKNKRVESKAKSREARAEGKRLRGEGKRLKGEGGGDSSAIDTGKDIFGTVIGGASQLVGAWKGNPQGGEDYQPAGGGNESSTLPAQRKPESDTVNIMGMELSKTTAIIGGVALVAIVGGGIYMATRKKK